MTTKQDVDPLRLYILTARHVAEEACGKCPARAFSIGARYLDFSDSRLETDFGADLGDRFLKLL